MSEQPPRVKVCGVTRLQDATLAAELGAWAVGMVLFADSPRRCSLDAAREIASTLRRRVALCGVFVNAPLGEVVATAEELDLALVQLHGDEGPAFCAEVGRRTGAQVIKAVQVRSAGDVTAVERFRVGTAFHLLDARPRRPGAHALRGGTGETFDWRLLAARRSRVPMILSGGLAPENVAAAVAAGAAHGLFAVDTASGTEAAPGRKDPQRLRAFFAAVRAGAPPQDAVSRGAVSRGAAVRGAAPRRAVPRGGGARGAEDAQARLSGGAGGIAVGARP